MTTSFRNSSWLVTVPLAAVAVVYLAFGWLPGRRAVQALQRETETQQRFVSESVGLQAALMATQRKLDRAESVAALWESKAPHKKETPSFYGKINVLAKDAGLTVSQFDPQPLVSHESIHEIPLSIRCSGRFTQIYDFLRGVEGLPVAIWAENMKLDKTTMDTQDVQCELKLVVFSNNS